MIALHVCVCVVGVVMMFIFFQAEDGIRDLVRSRGLGDVYKRQQHMDPGNGCKFGRGQFAATLVQAGIYRHGGRCKLFLFHIFRCRAAVLCRCLWSPDP